MDSWMNACRHGRDDPGRNELQRSHHRPGRLDDQLVLANRTRLERHLRGLGRTRAWTIVSHPTPLILRERTRPRCADAEISSLRTGAPSATLSCTTSRRARSPVGDRDRSTASQPRPPCACLSRLPARRRLSTRISSLISSVFYQGLRYVDRVCDPVDVRLRFVLSCAVRWSGASDLVHRGRRCGGARPANYCGGLGLVLDPKEDKEAYAESKQL